MAKTITFSLILSNLTKYRSNEIRSVNYCFSHASNQLSIQIRYKKIFIPKYSKNGFYLISFNSINGLLPKTKWRTPFALCYNPQSESMFCYNLCIQTSTRVTHGVNRLQ